MAWMPFPTSPGGCVSPPAISRQLKEPLRRLDPAAEGGSGLRPQTPMGNTRGSAGAHSALAHGGKQLGHLHVIWWGLFFGLILPRNPPAPPNLEVFQPNRISPTGEVGLNAATASLGHQSSAGRGQAMRMVVALKSFLQLLGRPCCARTQWGQPPEHLHRVLEGYGGHNPPTDTHGTQTQCIS